MTDTTEQVNQPLERVLRSRTFAASPSSRRLLRYLADKSQSEAAELKEYAVGIDVFGKPEAYDPQRDSTVRIQVGRLRQKLAEYYRGEGATDPVMLEIPKGGYRVDAVARPGVESAPGDSPAFLPVDSAAVAGLRRWRLVALGALLALAAVLIWAGLRPQTQGNWTPELERLWGRMLQGRQPLLIAVASPMFVEYRRDLLLRERSVDRWEKALESPAVAAVGKALGIGAARPSYYYVAAGEAGAAFSLAKALGPRKENISMVRDVQMSWQQIADNNILFLGPPRFFRDRLGDMPTSLEILSVTEGFRVAHPKPGEPELYANKGAQGDGETYALVTQSPGPGGRGEVLSFMSNDTFARAGAAQAYTDPEFARTLVNRLSAGGRFPHFYQVMLLVKLKGGVMTEIRYVLHRELVSRAGPA